MRIQLFFDQFYLDDFDILTYQAFINGIMLVGPHLAQILAPLFFYIK